MTTLPEMGVNINGDFGAKNWRSDPPRGMHQRLTLAEKQECARRANAYPKLVAVLRVIEARLAKSGSGADEDSRDHIHAALRELGEAS